MDAGLHPNMFWGIRVKFVTSFSEYIYIYIYPRYQKFGQCCTEECDFFQSQSVGLIDLSALLDRSLSVQRFLLATCPKLKLTVCELRLCNEELDVSLYNSQGFVSYFYATL